VIVLCACGARAAAAAPSNAAPVDDRARFQQVAREIAAGDKGEVIGWGTAPLGTDATPVEWATILYDVGHGDAGGYLIESAPGTYWFVHFGDDADGRWGESEATPPPWTLSQARSIVHKSTWIDGHARDEIAIRGGKPVLLAHDEHHKAEDGDPAQDLVDKVGPDGEAITSTDHLAAIGPASDAATISAAMRAE
jgi:hypothetical protein